MIYDESKGEDEEMTLDHVGPNPVPRQDSIIGRDIEVPTEAKRRKVEEEQEVLLYEEELNNEGNDEEDEEDIDVNSMLMKAFDV